MNMLRNPMLRLQYPSRLAAHLALYYVTFREDSVTVYILPISILPDYLYRKPLLRYMTQSRFFIVGLV